MVCLKGEEMINSDKGKDAILRLISFSTSLKISNMARGLLTWGRRKLLSDMHDLPTGSNISFRRLLLFSSNTKLEYVHPHTHSRKHPKWLSANWSAHPSCNTSWGVRLVHFVWVDKMKKKIFLLLFMPSPSKMQDFTFPWVIRWIVGRVIGYHWEPFSSVHQRRSAADGLSSGGKGVLSLQQEAIR